ncbi:MAG: Fic family protein [Limnobacter sp.]|uniref:Fic family protein n=1 Tax=Limnobacter sp. TaxID=2003368 RepID=UPI0032EB0F1C
MPAQLTPTNTTLGDTSLILYAELNSAQKRTVQRRLKAGELRLLAKGIASKLPEDEWPALVARERIRIVSALFPKAVYAFRTAFNGGLPEQGVLYVTHHTSRKISLPGLQIVALKGAPPQTGDMPMQGREVYFPSEARCLLENLSQSRGTNKRTTGREAVETRLLSICNTRGETSLATLRETARALAPTLGLTEEYSTFDSLVGSILKTRESILTTAKGRAHTAALPYDADRLALFEHLAATLRSQPLQQADEAARSPQAMIHFAFLESYFSNFIEGTEFDIEEAREIVLLGKPVLSRPKDSHDILGVFRQAVTPAWMHQVLASGTPIETQLRKRHWDQMQERPEVEPGEFKLKRNRASNTEFVEPEWVRGTLIQGSMLLPTIPAGLPRALFAMFLISEIHPFNDGNGRLARLVMNSELSVVGACRIIIPTLFRDEYLDCLRVLSREGNPAPFVSAMQKIQAWSAAFDYENLDCVISEMKRCNAFERSLIQHRLLSPQ